MPSYTAFGFAVRSNLHIPGLIHAAPPDEPVSLPALDVTLGSLPTDVSRETIARGRALFVGESSEGGGPSLVLREFPSGGTLVLEYADGTTFAIRADGERVWATWPDHLTIDDTATYLLGPVMALVLRLRGRFSLHAGVVALGHGAAAIAGGQEAGKSTIAGVFAQRGTRILSDDVAPVFEDHDHLFVHPTYPRVRLWQDSVAHLFGSPGALPLLTPTWEKRFLDVSHGGLFEDRPLPLLAVFVLENRVDAEDAPWVERLTGREAFRGRSRQPPHGLDAARRAPGRSIRVRQRGRGPRARLQADS